MTAPRDIIAGDRDALVEQMARAICLSQTQSEKMWSAFLPEARAVLPIAMEAAAKLADPPLIHRKGTPGLWRRRRAQIAAAIRQLGGGQ